mmetsp:Transcript_40170/g.64391  ORF Transcript_40170/g.64391 Transcript_40170/m.64391 type:complete len:87 (-) Transcript_40170:177-437(-)
MARPHRDALLVLGYSVLYMLLLVLLLILRLRLRCDMTMLRAVSILLTVHRPPNGCFLHQTSVRNACRYRFTPHPIPPAKRADASGG